MAHREQRDFFLKIRDSIPEAFGEVSVLEIGSLDINGTVRDFWPNATQYVGVDLGPGPGVDVIEYGERLDYADDSFDVAVSAECFEHNPSWEETFFNMWRMAKSFVIITCASEGRPEHGTHGHSPNSSPFTKDVDYYRNLNEADFHEAFPLDDLFDEYFFEYNPKSKDLYFFGRL